MVDYSSKLLGSGAPGAAAQGRSYSDALLGGAQSSPPPQHQGPGFLSRTASAIGSTLYNASPLGLIEDVGDVARQGLRSSDQFPYFRLPESVGERHEAMSQAARDIAPFAIGGPAGGAFRTGAGAMARRIGGEAAGGAIAEFGKQTIEEGQISPSRVAATAALGAAGAGAGEAVGLGLNRYMNRHVAPDIDRADFNQVNRLRALADEQGIQLTPAELTNLPSLKAEQKMLGNLPQSSDTLADFQRMRADEQIEPAIQRYLDSISEQFGDEASGEMARAAANRAQDAVAQVRADQARPLYQQAFAEARPVNTDDLITGLSEQIRQAPEGGEIRRSLQRVRRMLGTQDETGNFVPVQDMNTLHLAKVEIDQMLEGVNLAKRVGGTTRARLQGVKTSLLEALDEASPTYADARAIFADLSPGVARVREGVAGTIADLPDQQLRTVAARLFDKAKISPRAAREARQQLQAADPQAWQAIKRSYIEDAWIKASEQNLTSGGTPVSAGAKFRKRLLGNAKQMQVLRATLEPEEFSALNNIATVLEASARVKPIGSDTAWNQEMLKAMKRNGRGPISRVLGAADPRILARVSDAMDERGFEAYTQELAQMITTPGGVDFIRQLQQASPNNRVRSAILGYAIGVGTTKGGEAEAADAAAQQPEAPAAPELPTDPTEALLNDPSGADPQTLQTMALAEIVKSLRGGQTPAAAEQQAAAMSPEDQERLAALEGQRASMAEQIAALQQAAQQAGGQTQAMAAVAEDQQALMQQQAIALAESTAVEQALPPPAQAKGKTWTRKSATPERDDQGRIVAVNIVEVDEDGKERTKRAVISRDEMGRFTGLTAE